MGDKTYEKEAKQNKHVKAKTKQTNKNLGFLGNGITHARIGLRIDNLACMRGLDYAYANPCPENLKTQKQSRTLKQKSNNLTCTQHKKN